MKQNLRLQSSLLVASEILVLLSSVAWSQLAGSSSWPAWLYVFLLGTGGYILASSRKWLVAYATGCVGAVGFGSVEAASPVFDALSAIFFAFAYALLFRAIIRHCFFKPSVLQADRVLGGIAGYLLLGFFWISQFRWAILADPDAFVHQATGMSATPMEMLYFSFVTLLGLGYGDFVPKTDLARLLSILTGLSGALYLAIFIAALIGRPASPDQDAP